MLAALSGDHEHDRGLAQALAGHGHSDRACEVAAIILSRAPLDREQRELVWAILRLDTRLQRLCQTSGLAKSAVTLLREALQRADAAEQDSPDGEETAREGASVMRSVPRTGAGTGGG